MALAAEISKMSSSMSIKSLPYQRNSKKYSVFQKPPKQIDSTDDSGSGSSGSPTEKESSEGADTSTRTRAESLNANRNASKISTRARKGTMLGKGGSILEVCYKLCSFLEDLVPFPYILNFVLVSKFAQTLGKRR